MPDPQLPPWVQAILPAEPPMAVSHAQPSLAPPQQPAQPPLAVSHAQPQPPSAWQKAETIGAPQIGEHYVPPSFNEIMASDNPLGGVVERAMGLVAGPARPQTVAAADPYGITAWMEHKGPPPAMFLGSTEALTPEAAAEHLSRAPVEHVGDRLLVSPRILGAKGRNFTPAEPGQILLPTVAAAAQDPEYFAKLAAHARESPMLTPRETRLSDPGVVSAFADRGAENIDALFDMASPTVRNRGGRWYPGGQAIGDAIAKEAGLPVNAGAGAIARLSPGTDWDMNIDNAQRLGRWWKTFNQTDQPFTQQHLNQYVDSTLMQADQWIHSNKLTGPSLAKYQAVVGSKLAETRGFLDEPWSQLPYKQRAQLIRAHSELTEPQTFARYAPEGHVVIPEARGVNGDPLSVKWQSYDNLSRVLAMFDDPSDASISSLLGKGHKIRSFFNNLSVPNDPRSLTADVHNVAGTNLRPIGANQPEVLAVTGGKPGSAQTGIEGTYPLYQEATQRAAAARGMVPNKAQSIPWETTRGLFSPAQRRNDQFRAMANQIWGDYQRGRISLHAAQGQLHDLAGGVTPPAWASYPAQPIGAK